MNTIDFKKKLEEDGYVIIEDILTSSEVSSYKSLFYDWIEENPQIKDLHNKIDPHGIFKYNQAAHQRFAWDIRINQNIQKIFKEIWNCEDLVVSFDSMCWIEKDINKKDTIWTHTDQTKNSDFICVQGLVAITSNEKTTLVVYPGSHKLHSSIISKKGVVMNKWHLIDHEYLDNLKKKILNIKAGSLVLWDSRMIHQNMYRENSEERLVQYVCYLPKNNIGNNKKMREKRLRYFNDLRTTSHWPYPIKVVGKQPHTWGNENLLINYSLLKKPELSDIEEKIMEIL